MARDPNLDQADAMLVVAEELVAQARLAGERCGLDADATGLTVLQHAFAMAVADAIGPDAGPDRHAIGVLMAVKAIKECVAVHYATRTCGGRR